MRMGKRNVISGPTIWASLAFGVHPVGITKAVSRPHARIAPILGITIPARKPPNLWTLARQPPVATGTGTGSAIDIAHTPFSRVARFRCGRSQGTKPVLRWLIGPLTTTPSGHRVRRCASGSRQHHLHAGVLERTPVHLGQAPVGDQGVDLP